jgi:hypothetical protein
MHPKMQHSVRSITLLEPLVKRGVLGVWGQIALKKQAHGIPLHPQRGLNPDPDVAELDPTHYRIACSGT